MRRWNGWGDESVSVALPEPARRFLAEQLGAAHALPDVAPAALAARLPPSALKDLGSIDTSDMTRLRHARGQSIPDLLALRSGEMGRVPDGVAFPQSREEVRDLLRYAASRNATVIPYGGGTSVVGHVTPAHDVRPVLTIDLCRMNQLLDLDSESGVATFGPGAPGPQVEAQLRAHGYLLGHYPQSFEYSTLGGWVATRSSGQQSLRYGRIEQLFAGGSVETPAGTLPLPTFPASAAGPDLRELVLGSEGRLGVITEVKVRVTPVPEIDRFFAVFFPDWTRALRAVREAVQARVPLSMLRLSNRAETAMQLLIAGDEAKMRWLRRYLSWRGAGEERCLLMVGVSGFESQTDIARLDALSICRDHGGVGAPPAFGRAWSANRFRAPYLREALWRLGYVVDTLETAADWSRVDTLVTAVEAALAQALREDDEAVHAFTHLSHVYPQGSSCYTTFIFRMGADHAATLARWRQLKAAASSAILAHGGTISHQHGVGADHAPYLKTEKGALGLAGLQTLYRHFDPQSIMNPGKLFIP